MEHESQSNSEKPWRWEYPWRAVEEAVRYLEELPDSLGINPRTNAREKAIAQRREAEFLDTLDLVAQEDSQAAIEIIAGLAASPMDNVREIAAHEVVKLLTAHKEAGIEILCRLIEDEDEMISRDAAEALEIALIGGYLTDEEGRPLVLAALAANERREAYNKFRRGQQ